MSIAEYFRSVTARFTAYKTREDEKTAEDGRVKEEVARRNAEYVTALPYWPSEL